MSSLWAWSHICGVGNMRAPFSIMTFSRTTLSIIYVSTVVVVMLSVVALNSGSPSAWKYHTKLKILARDKPGKSYWRGRISTHDLLVLTSSDNAEAIFSTYLNEEVNGTEPYPSVSFPWTNALPYLSGESVSKKKKFYTNWPLLRSCHY